MAFNVNTFLSKISRTGLSSKSAYEVLISGPQALEGLSDEQDLIFRCESVNEPGRNILTTNDSYHYGIPQARAYGTSFNEITLSIILSDDYREKLYFERWQDLIVGPYRNGELGPNMFDINYFDEYKGSANIYRYDDSGNLTYTINLKNTFPVLVGDVDLSWADREIARLPVRMWFQYYTND